MKIAHVIASFSIDYPGGITNYMRVLIASQLADGHRVDVIDGVAGEEWEIRADGTRVRSVAATRRLVHVASSREDASGTAEFIRLVRSEEYDLVHFHLTIGMGESLYAAFASAGIPYAVTLHDYYLFCPRITMMDWRGENCGGPAPKKCERCVGVLDQIDPLYRLSRKSGIPLPRVLPSKMVTRRNGKIEGFLVNARAVFAISKAVARYFEGVYPGLSCIVAHVGTPSAGQPWPAKTPARRMRLGFLGTLSRHKGVDVLIALMEGATRPDIEFHFYGRALEPDALRRFEEAGGVSHGPYSEADLPEIMSQVDLGLVLSQWEEGAGIVVMEFLNHGVPVLATDRGGIPDFVNERNGYLFTPDASGIRGAVEFVERLDVQRLDALVGGIRPLTTPAEHWRLVHSAYRGDHLEGDLAG